MNNTGGGRAEAGPLSDPVIEGQWVRPSTVFPAEPRWGHAKGIQVGLHPIPGPRGLLRIFAPYLGHTPDRVINFIAIEPIPAGAAKRGYSELEPSVLDPAPGKRFWSSDHLECSAAIEGERPAQGIVEKVDGVEHLRVYIVVEPFDNGAQVAVRLSFREDLPHEIGLSTYRLPGSVELDYCVLTATMGNFARLRDLHLADRLEKPVDLWPNFAGTEFTDHAHFGLDRIPRTPAGEAVVWATPNEPPTVAYDAAVADHWKYYGKRAVQLWKVKDPDPRLEVLVNARRFYWASKAPIPWGASFENFELFEPFRQAREFTFCVHPSADA